GGWGGGGGGAPAVSDFRCGLKYVAFRTCGACAELTNLGGGHSTPVMLATGRFLWLFLTTTTPSWRRCGSAGTSPRYGGGTKDGHRPPGGNCPNGHATRWRWKMSALLS